LSIISEDFVFLLLINNTGVIAVSGDEKVIRNARHIDIHYHHIQNLIEKKMIEISHISTDEMTVNDFTKMLLSNKFKEFVELVRILKIEIDSSNDKSSNSELSDDKLNNSKFNDSKSNNNKNDENLVANYYEAGKEADKEISFKTEEAE